MDSAFYNEILIDPLHRTGVTFTASVPFERWTQLKSMWVLRQLGTIRQKLLRRVGRLTRPGNKWVLSINADAGVEQEMNHYLDALQAMA